MTDALLPAMLRKAADVSRRGAGGAAPPLPRVVNVCSGAGTLRILRSEALARRFLDADSPRAVFALVDEFVAAVGAGTHARDGSPGSMYGVSKLGEAALTRALAKAHAGELVVAAVCPG